MAMDQNLAWAAVVVAAIAIGYALILSKWIKTKSEGTDRMKQLAKAVQEGAMAFLTTEYKLLSIFVVIIAVVLAVVLCGQAFGKEPPPG